MSKIKILRNDEIIFSGNILDIPIKEDYIIKKSIDIFADCDPCIIHKSYVIKKIVEDIIKKTDVDKIKTVNLTKYKDQLFYLNFDLEGCQLYFEG